MALIDDNRDDNLERDPQLAHLYRAVAGEEPPAALDAVILAAARREVGARPQALLETAGGGGAVAAPVIRRKRSWYVPLSIAAVLVLSVSVVILVHEEKGDELAQPPRAANEPAKRSARVPASAPPAAAPAEASGAASGPALQPAKPDALLREAAPAKAKIARESTVPDAVVAAPAASQDVGTLAKKQPGKEISGTVADDAAATGGARKDQPAGVPAQAAKTEAAPGGIAGGLSSGTPLPAPAASMSERRPEPFQGANEREANAQTSRDTDQARARSEADRVVTRGVAREATKVPSAPIVSAAPPAPVAAAPRLAPVVEDTQKQSALPQAEGRVQAAPPPAARSAPPAKSSARVSPQVPVWRGLEEQPPEKWLDRLAEFKRDGRQADIDELLTEFRRRFPDHPASVR